MLHITSNSSGTFYSLPGFTSLHILANYKKPLNWALGLQGVFVNIKVLIFLLIILLSGCTSTPSTDSSMIDTLSGTWDEASDASCSANYHTIAFKDSVLEVKYVEKGYISENDGREVLKYNILSANKELLRVQLVDETRLDNQGQPVIWHLKLLNTEQYCWGRDDWEKNGCTPPRYKCKPNK